VCTCDGALSLYSLPSAESLPQGSGAAYINMAKIGASGRGVMWARMILLRMRTNACRDDDDAEADDDAAPPPPPPSGEGDELSFRVEDKPSPLGPPFFRSLAPGAPPLPLAPSPYAPSAHFLITEEALPGAVGKVQVRCRAGGVGHRRNR
jgi:hypothetical protein